MVGYHGLASGSRPCRQSGSCGNMTKVGLPSAPARCATAVSQVTTTSRLAMIAAVSSKCEISRCRSTKCGGSDAPASCVQPAPICSETQHVPGTSSNERTAANPGERSRLLRSAGLLAQTSPKANSRPGWWPAALRRSRHCHVNESRARRYGAAAASGARPRTCGRLMRATCVSNAGVSLPRTQTASTPSTRDARPCSPSITSSTTRPPRRAASGTKRRNCKASPKPCSAQTSSVRPARSLPSHVGGAQSRGAGSPRRKRHSYSRKPSLKRPARNSASDAFQ